MDYYTIIREATKHHIGNLVAIDGARKLYLHDRFIFEFPLINKRTLTIYVYDDSYNLYTDFHNATLKVFENDQWVEEGVWKDKISDYMERVQDENEQLKYHLQWERKMAEYSGNRKEIRRLKGFLGLFDVDVVEGVPLSHQTPSDKSYRAELPFVSTDTLSEFLYVLLGAETIDISN